MHEGGAIEVAETERELKDNFINLFQFSFDSVYLLFIYRIGFLKR